MNARNLLVNWKKILQLITSRLIWEFYIRKIISLYFALYLRHVLDHGDFEYLFKFSSKEDIEKWGISTDKGYEIGKSTAEFKLTQQNTGLFTGYLSNEFDKPEKMKAVYTGYANIHSLTHYKSFGRVERLNLTDCTHFLIRLRGDGRSYMMILHTPDIFTLTYTYMHATPLYTRGGPYWQYAKIPLSKFFHVSHGRVSDRQFRVTPRSIKNIGITCMDGVEGPFSLEIDFIGVLKDKESTEDFAYETYRIPKYVGNT